MRHRTNRAGKVGGLRNIGRHRGAAPRSLRLESLEPREMLSASDLMYLAVAGGTQLAVTAPTAPVLLVGSAGPRAYMDLAVSSSGDVYGVANGAGTSELYSIDPANGTGTLVSTLTSKWNVNALDFVDGALYAADRDYGELIRWASGNTWEHVAWLNGSAGDLAYQETTERLYYVDRNTHLAWFDLSDLSAGISDDAIGYDGVYAMDFTSDGKLYAVANPAASAPILLELDLATGHGTPKQTYSGLGEIWGLAATQVTVDVWMAGTSGLATSESGTSDTYTIGLSSQPFAEVTIGLSSSDTTEGTVLPASLIFTPANWSTPQTVTVTGVDDTIGDGPVEYRITAANTVSTDARYNGIAVPAVYVTNADNDPPAVQFHAAAQSALESAGTMTIFAQLTSVTTVDVVVPFSVSGTATPAVDYTITSSPLLIRAGYASAEITVSLLDDAAYEGNETVIVTLGTPSGATLGAITTHTATIVDDDPAPVVSFQSAGQSVAENGGTMTLKVLLSAASGTVVMVPFTVSGTATGNGTDYWIPASPIAISAGQLSADLTINLTSDALDEDDETVIVTLGTPSGAVLGTPSTHTATIVDDDAPPTLQFPSGGQNKREDDGTVNVALQLSAISGRAVTVPFTLEGSATYGSDYTVAASPITIPAGQTSATIAVNLIDDPNYEPEETIGVRLATPTNATLGTVTLHTITVTDNDSPPRVQFSGPSQTVSEGVGTAMINVVLSVASGFPVTVPYSVTAGSAQGGGVDYRLTDAVLTIPVGQTSAAIPVEVIDDRVDEPDETLTVTLGTPGGAVPGGVLNHTLTIADNDPPPTVQFSLPQQTVSEAVGTMTITVELSTISAFPVTLPFTTAGSASGAPGIGDYTIDASPVTIPPGQQMVTINVTVRDDLLDEPDETLVVTLGVPTNAIVLGNASHAATIIDNDPAPYVQWQLPGQAAAENQGAITVVAVLSSISGLPVTLPFTIIGTASGGTDYTVTSSPIVILPGDTTGAATVGLIDDALHEWDESLTLSLVNPVNATLGPVTDHTISITDNDPPPTVGLTAASQSVSESVGTVTVTALLSALSGAPVVLPFTLSGTATEGEDYTLLTPSPIIIPAGQMTGSISLNLAKDLVDEPDETVVVALGTPSDATLAGTTTHTVTVHNAPTVQFTTAVQTAAEDAGTITVDVQLSTTSVLPAVLPFTTSGTATAGQDYTVLTPSPITIPAGQTGATITIQFHEDALYEGNETVVVALGGPNGAVLGPQSIHSATIADNDPPPVVQFTAGSQTVVESAGTVTVTAQLSTVSGLPVTLPFSLSGTATDGADYTVAANPITILAGQTTGSITLDLVGDFMDEGDETVIVTLQAPTYATLGTTTIHTVTVHNAPVVQFTAQEQTGPEGIGTITLTAQLSTASVLPVTLPLTLGGTATAGADYTISPNPIVIPAGQTTGTTTINVSNDALDEDDETIVVSLATPINAVLGPANTFTATITDDDPSPSVEFLPSAQSFAENGSAFSVVVELSAISGRAVTVPFTMTGTATNGIDYTVSASPLVIPAGQASGTITINPIDDAIDELNEYVQLTLGQPTNAVLGGAWVRTLLITDDDPAPVVQFTTASQSADESAGTMTITVELLALSGLNVLVPFTVSGSATPGADYAITASPIMIPAGQTTATITVDLVSDGKAETNETVIVRMQQPTYATLGAVSTHTATILGEGLPPATIGLFDPAASGFYLRGSNTSGPADFTFGYGQPGGGWKVLVGDWNGDGATGVGLYSPQESTFYLTNAYVSGFAEHTFGYGEPGAGWIPLVGDWDGNGSMGVGLYDPRYSTFYLTNSLASGFAEHTFGYGQPDAGWIPIVGDWDGNGSTGVGLYDPHTSLFYLTNTLSAGFAEHTFGYGQPDAGWQPMVGDWDGDRSAGVGLYDPQGSWFYLTNAFVSGFAQYTFGYGAPGAGWKPLVGDWDGSGTSGVGLYEPAWSTFYLTDSLQTGVAEYTAAFGDLGVSYEPIIGSWIASPKPAAPSAKAVDQLDLAALVAAELSGPGSQETDWLMANGL